MGENLKYFIKNGEKIDGPYTLHEARNLTLKHDTLAWKEGMYSWSMISEFEEFRDIYPKVPPPILIEFKEEKQIVAEEVIAEDAAGTSKKKHHRYFIYSNDKTKGPYSAEEIRNMNLAEDVLIWKEGSENWQKRSEFKELKIVNYTPPNPPANKNINKTVNRSDSGGGVSVFTLIILCLLVILFFLCVMNTRSCSGCHMYSCHDTDTIKPSPKPLPPVINYDSIEKARLNEHLHYLNEIEDRINAFYKMDAHAFSSYRTNNTSYNKDSKYYSYLSSTSAEIIEKYKEEQYIKYDRESRSEEKNINRYSKYVEDITIAANDYFKEHIDTLSNKESLYDRTFLECITEMMQTLIDDKKPDSDEPKGHHCHHRHHPRHCCGCHPKPHPRPHPKPKPPHHPKCNNCCCETFSYVYKPYPNIFLGHYVDDIYNAFGAGTNRYDNAEDNTYTMSYFYAAYETEYIIDKGSNTCTKFLIKFYNGKYYNAYLGWMFARAIPITNEGNYWTSTYECKKIEIDHLSLGEECTPALVYYVTNRS